MSRTVVNFTITAKASDNGFVDTEFRNLNTGLVVTCRLDAVFVIDHVRQCVTQAVAVAEAAAMFGDNTTEAIAWCKERLGDTKNLQSYRD